MKNPNVQKAVKVVTVAGSAIIVLGAGMQLMKQPFTVKGSIMPLVTILVGVAAFNYAMKSSAPTVVTTKA
mgnify:CR=1 FL=1